MQTGVLIVRDPRCSAGDADAFTDMMERYFQQPREAKLADVRSNLHYQVRIVLVPAWTVGDSF